MTLADILRLSAYAMNEMLWKATSKAHDKTAGIIHHLKAGNKWLFG